MRNYIIYGGAETVEQWREKYVAPQQSAGDFFYTAKENSKHSPLQWKIFVIIFFRKEIYMEINYHENRRDKILEKIRIRP